MKKNILAMVKRRLERIEMKMDSILQAIEKLATVLAKMVITLSDIHFRVASRYNAIVEGVDELQNLHVRGSVKIMRLVDITFEYYFLTMLKLLG